MLIRDLHIRGFGKFNNYKINFGEGLNIVYGDNEAGKSTVHQFIQGMLFGFFKPYIKTKKYTEVYDKYLPWNMKEGYEGTLIFEENNKAYRIERNFMKRHDSFKLYNEITGEDITKQLPYNPVTKLPDIYGLIGLSETAFKNTISISQLQSQTDSKLAIELKDYMTNLSTSKEQDISVKNVIKKLETELDKIGTERRSQSPLGITCSKITDLEKEREATVRKHEEMIELREKLNQLKESQNENTKKLKIFEDKLKQFNQIELLNQYNKAKNLETEMSNLERKIESLEKYESIDLNQIDDLLRIQEQINMTNEQMQENEKQIMIIKNKLEENKDLLKQLNIEKCTLEELDNYTNISVKYELLLDYQYKEKATSTSVETIKKQAQENEEKYNEDIVKDYGLFNNIEQEKKYLLSQLEQEQEKSKEEANIKKQKAKQKSLYIASGVIFVISLLFSILYSEAGSIILGVGLILTAIICMIGLSKDKELKRLKGQLNEYIEKERNLEEKISIISKNQAEILSKYQLNDRESFDGLKEDMSKTFIIKEELKRNLKEKESELIQIRDKIERLENYIKSVISSFDINEEITDKTIERVKFLQRKGQQLLQDKEYLINQKDVLINKTNNLQKKLSNLFNKKQNILKEQKISESDNLKDVKAKIKKVNDMKIELENKSKLITEILKGDTLNNLKSKIELEVENVIEDNSLAKEEIEKNIQSIHNKQMELTKIISINETKLSNISNSVRYIGEIDCEIQDELSKKEKLEKKIKALEIAKNTLEKVSNDIHNDFAPQLNKSANNVIKEITNNKYSKVKINKDLDLLVEEEKLNKLVSVEQLSNGTMDQMYFALRIGIIDLITDNKNYPLFLDDAFVQYDEIRLRNVLSLLGRSNRQIILLTCQKREKNILDLGSIKYNYIKL